MKRTSSKWGMFHAPRGQRTRSLIALLKRRELTAPENRQAFDARRSFRRQTVVFTDTADFTIRTLRDGILHFLMLFDRFVRAARPAAEGCGGEIVKVEGDSLLLRFDDPESGLRAIEAIELARQQLNAGRPAKERLRLSYGIGHGEIVDIEGDLFGLEVNLASKLGEDLAQPGEVLLTPAAAAALPRSWHSRIVPYSDVAFGQTSQPVKRYRLKRPSAARRKSR